MTKVFTILLMALAFASCENADSSKDVETVTSAPAPVTSPAAPVAEPGSQSMTTTAIPAAQPAAATSAASNPVAAGLNPAHGAPGHRCDIAVGAPLNSPAGNTAAPAMTTIPAPATTQTPVLAQPANPNAKLNPAHGQPGHDCSVPVGQPLKG
jgi:hypothetical protein